MGACDIHLRAVAQLVANQNSNVFVGRAIVNDSEIFMRRLSVLSQPFVRYCLFSLPLVLSLFGAPKSLGQEVRSTEILSELIRIEQSMLGGRFAVRCGSKTFRIQKPLLGELIIREPDDNGGWKNLEYSVRAGHTFSFPASLDRVSISDLTGWNAEKESLWVG